MPPSDVPAGTPDPPPAPEIGQIVGCRQDARQQATHRPTGARQQQRAVVDAFLLAAHSGDFEELLRVLDPNVTSRTYTARGAVIKLGATEVATAAQRSAHTKTTEYAVLVNGEPGIVARGTSGKLVGVMGCTAVDGRIVQIISLTDPDRLAAMNLPEPPK
jgi:hypothetical protein